MRRRWTVCLTTLIALSTARIADANGRFPQASFFVAGPGSERSDVMVLRATFGLLTTRDGGCTWNWICEDAMSEMGQWDAPVAIGADGTVIAGIYDGLRTSPTLCDWSRPLGDPADEITDLAADATGMHVVAAVTPAAASNALALSDDSGHTWRAGASMNGFFIETVEVAPSRPARMYVSAYLTGAIAALFRSDDGGQTLVEVTRAFDPGTDVFISAVDSHDPDTLYLRANVGTSTRLLKSTDGGVHFTTLVETHARMIGFAVSDDGRTVWAGSEDPTEGILRSTGGAPFARIAPTVHLQCLRYHAGALYVCATELTDGYSLGRSLDDGDHITPIASLRRIAGALDCPTGTGVHDRCVAEWPAQQTLLSIDAAAPVVLACIPDGGPSGFDARADTSTDATPALDAATTLDAALTDASPDATTDEHPPLRATGGCHCTAARIARTNPWPGPAALIASAGLARRRRRRTWGRC